MTRLHIIPPSAIGWPFSNDGRPYLSLLVGESSHTVYVDPFVSYAHDAALTEKEIEYVESRIKLPFPPDYFVLPFDSTSHTNGWADGNSTYIGGQDEKGEYKTEPRPFIVLAGKRIPLHPAMTRYLVAHEYGHIVHANLAHSMGIKYDEFKEVYAGMRGIECIKEYGGGKCHLNIGEIIANDVRIGLLEKETEFWPHVVERPGEKVVSWWREQIAKYWS
jgi:hypothetical protein